MPAAWRTVRVFISSTFRDMQAERDHLVRFVFPRLREELLRRRMHLVDVDLRWGVTSEQDAQQVCREIIDECRPRFLCMLGGRYGWTPPGRDRSITADEVHCAALDQGEPDRHRFFYFRASEATAAMVEEHPGQYREPPGSETEQRLEELKQAIQGAGYEPFVYPARWSAEQGRLVGLEEFGRRVYDDLLASINEEFGTEAPEPVDEFAEETARQEAFVSERTARYVVGSRQPVLDRVAEFASSDGEPSILAITGAPGSGKSALLGRAYQDLTAAHPDWLVVPHFVGASAGSTDLRRSLRRLCHELQRVPGDDEPLPDGVEELITRLPMLLEQAGGTRRAVLIIDALDQMDSTDGAHTLRWLPRQLPENVRIVVSSLGHPVLDALRLRRGQVGVLELARLTSADSRAIAEGFADRYHKRLREEQLEALLAKPERGSPLYLLVALEELRTLGTYEEITARIEQLPGRVQELFLWILQERLSTDPGFQDAQGNLVGAELVRKCVSCLGVSRHGLSHAELVGTVDPGDSRGNVAALERLLRPYLMRRGDLLDFYHGQLREAVEAEYLDEEHERLEAHDSLASYFSEQGYGNLRTLAELPYHQTQAGMWDELECTLTDLPFLEGKGSAGMVFELARDFAAALYALRADRPQRRILYLLNKGLQRDIYFIARHASNYPQALFQSLWNSAWWYDSPEAAKRYLPFSSSGEGQGEGSCVPSPANGREAGRDGALSLGDGPRASEKLHRLLERWRHQKEEATPNSPWLRALRPPPIHLSSAELAVLRGHEGRVNSVAFSSREDRIASGSADNTVRLWDAQSGAELAVFRRHLGGVQSVAFSPGGDRIASGAGDCTVRVWDADTGAELARLARHQSDVRSVAFSPGGDRILSGSWHGTVRVWDAQSGAELVILRGHEKAVESVAFSPDGGRILSGSEDSTVRVWDAESGQELAVLRGHKGLVRSVAFSHGGDRIIIGSWDGTVRVWDAQSRVELAVLRGHEHAVNSVTVSPSGDRIFSGSGDKTVRVWDAQSGVELAVLRAHESGVNSVAVSSSGDRIFSGSDDNTVRVWDAQSQVELPVLPGHEDDVTSVAFSPRGDRIASAAWYGDNTVRLWDAQSGAELAILRGHEGRVESVAFSPRGDRIASAGGYGDSTVRVWDAQSGAELAILRGHKIAVNAVIFSAEGEVIVSGSSDSTVRVWDAASGAELAILGAHLEWNAVGSVALSPNGDRIASGCDVSDGADNAVRVWDAASGAELAVLRGHKNPVWSVAFSPGGDRIFSGSGDKTVRVWDAQSGVELAVLRGHKWGVDSVAFFPGGDRIASGSWVDKTVRVWDAATGECLEVIQGVGDVHAIAGGPPQFPLRAISRGQETLVEPANGGQPVASFPVSFRHITTHPNGRTWAGSSANHIYIITLEGDVPAPQVEPSKQQ